MYFVKIAKAFWNILLVWLNAMTLRYEDSIFESIYKNLDALANSDIGSMYFTAIDQYKKLKS